MGFFFLFLFFFSATGAPFPNIKNYLSVKKISLSMIKTCVLVLVHVLECYDGYAICICVCTSCDTGHLCALLSDVVNMFVSNLSRVWCNISHGEKMKTML